MSNAALCSMMSGLNKVVKVCACRNTLLQVQVWENLTQVKVRTVNMGTIEVQCKSDRTHNAALHRTLIFHSIQTFL